VIAGAAPEHFPVMVDEVLEALEPRPGQTVVDGTVGLGGHAAALLARIQPGGVLVGLDRDAEALERARVRLAPFGAAVLLAHSRFDRIQETLKALGVTRVDAALLDLGVSSMQLDEAERGFSFMRPGPLDMRMDRSGGRTAADLVAVLEEDELREIFFEYGEERWSRRIAGRIVDARERRAITTTDELARIVERAVPGGRQPIHPATRVFQALRIAVNEELSQIGPTLQTVVELLPEGGRLAVIAFHSLEDRIVKQTFARLAGACVCPPGLPMCGCGARATVRPVVRKAVKASEAEVQQNSRARSARLRAVVKLETQS